MSGPASYPLPLLLEEPPEWMLDVMVELYQAEIVGTHGFGIRHPRARWLRLVVSDRIECSCGDLARWEDVCGSYREIAWCPRCADAEIALEAARVPAPLMEYQTEPTLVEEFISTAQLAKMALASLETRA